MQRHVSYNKDAVIQNPLHFILLIKLLIMPFSFPLFFHSKPQHFIYLEAQVLQQNFVRKYVPEKNNFKPVTKQFYCFLSDSL